MQFMGNLAQLALLVVIITGAAAVAGERRAGTAVLVLTKPLSRAAFVWAKVVANLAVLVIATAIGAALCIVVTILLFDTAHIAAFLESVALWLALAAMFVCLMVFLSAALDRQAAAAGAGLAVYAAHLRHDRLPAAPRPQPRRAARPPTTRCSRAGRRRWRCRSPPPWCSR